MTGNLTAVAAPDPELVGWIDEALPNRRFVVRLESGHRLLSRPSGRLRMHYVRIRAGQRVRIEVVGRDGLVLVDDDGPAVDLTKITDVRIVEVLA